MAKPLDPRLQSPNTLPVVKVDNLYQLKREKLHEYQLFEHDFVDSTPAPPANRIFCGSWEYMQVLTDGGFNQDNIGYGETHLSSHSVCSIIFNDNEEYTLKAETPTPIPLIKKKFFDFWNQMADAQPDAEGIETGYGTIKILMTNYPYQWNLQKIMPHFCNADPITPSTHQYWWFGVNKPNGLYDVAIPYLPPRYSCIRICFWTDNVLSVTLNVTQYCCLNGTYSCRQEIVSSGCTTIPACSQRILFDIHNTHAGDTYNYCLDVLFMEGCWAEASEPA